MALCGDIFRPNGLMKLGGADGSYPRRILCSLNIESIDWRILSSYVVSVSVSVSVSVPVRVDCAIPSAATIVLSVVIGYWYIVFLKPPHYTADPRRCIVNVAGVGDSG